MTRCPACGNRYDREIVLCRCGHWDGALRNLIDYEVTERVRLEREQDERLRRLRNQETTAERISRLYGQYVREPEPWGPDRLANPPGARTWHDWRRLGLARDCTRLDGHLSGCRRVSESVENRPLPSSPDVDRWVIVVEATVDARG